MSSNAHDAAPDVRTQVLALKVAELQQCASALGIARYGRKADLQSRIMAYLGELRPPAGEHPSAPMASWQIEHARRVVLDIYRASRSNSARPSISSQLPSHAAAAAPRSTAAHKALPYAHAALSVANNHGNSSSSVQAAPVNVRCLCLSTQPRSTMVQCADPTCGVWQHAECVGRATHSKDASEPSKEHYCELCRAHLADPFWQTVETLLPPARLKHVVGQAPIQTQYNEILPHQSAERAVFLGEQQLSAARNGSADSRVQIGCLLIDDPVLLRYHWPRNVTLRVNSMHYRPYSRSLTAKMGINQRDDAASIGSLCLVGRNALDITAVDVGNWVLLLQRVQRRSLDQVKALMAQEETLEEAVERVKRTITGRSGDAAPNDDDDDDIIAVSHQVASLKDPMSGQRMTLPARFIDASGLQPFDLDSFLSIVKSNRKWQDPTTLKNSHVRRLQCDAYMRRVLACVSQLPDISVVDIDDQARWRPQDSEGEWIDITTPVEDVRKKLAEEQQERRRSLAAADGKPTGVNRDKKTKDNNSKPGDSGVVISDDSETDEEEELRRAAAAVRPPPGNPAVGSKRPAENEPEVIELLDSSDEDEVAGPPRRISHQNSQQQQQQQHNPTYSVGESNPPPTATGGVKLTNVPVGHRRSMAGQARIATGSTQHHHASTALGNDGPSRLSHAVPHRGGGGGGGSLDVPHSLMMQSSPHSQPSPANIGGGGMMIPIGNINKAAATAAAIPPFVSNGYPPESSLALPQSLAAVANQRRYQAMQRDGVRPAGGYSPTATNGSHRMRGGAVGLPGSLANNQPSRLQPVLPEHTMSTAAREEIEFVNSNPELVQSIDVNDWLV